MIRLLIVSIIMFSLCAEDGKPTPRLDVDPAIQGLWYVESIIEPGADSEWQNLEHPELFGKFGSNKITWPDMRINAIDNVFIVEDSDTGKPGNIIITGHAVFEVYRLDVTKYYVCIMYIVEDGKDDYKPHGRFIFTVR